MTMKNSNVAERFIASLERSPRLGVPTQELGQVARDVPGDRWGSGCIVLRVQDMIVRLSEHGNLWIAEDLVVRESDG